MAEFMMFTRGRPENWNRLSPEETQKVMEGCHAYVNRLKKDGRYKAGAALKDGGFLLRADGPAITVDGPYAETKEVMTGYVLFEAKDQAEAIEIAKGCPFLFHGEQVEVREISGNSQE